MLKSIRGAAAAVLSLDAGVSVLYSVRDGNVVRRRLSSFTDRAILTQQGTAKFIIRKPVFVSTSWLTHAVVTVRTDSIMQQWPSAVVAMLLKHNPSLAATLRVRDVCRGRDDVTIMAVRRK